MSTEIKLNDVEVKAALSELKSVATQLESSFATSIEGENKLDMVNEWNALKEQMNELVSSYQQLLLKSTNITMQTIETMKETDEAIASNMKQLEV